MQELDSDVAARTWVRNGDKIVQRADPSRCLQLRDERCQGKNGNKIDEEEYTGGEVQRWVFDYKNWCRLNAKWQCMLTKHYGDKKYQT